MRDCEHKDLTQCTQTKCTCGLLERSASFVDAVVIKPSPMFVSYQNVRHVKTGNLYQICEVPSTRRLLEYCSEPFYTYFDLVKNHAPSILWVRRQSEMEDGRFEAL